MSEELKQRIMAEIAKEYPHGVYFAALVVRPVKDAELTVTVIEQHINVQSPRKAS